MLIAVQPPMVPPTIAARFGFEAPGCGRNVGVLLGVGVTCTVTATVVVSSLTSATAYERSAVLMKAAEAQPCCVMEVFE